MYRAVATFNSSAAATFPAPIVSIAFHVAEVARAKVCVDRRWPLVMRKLTALRQRGRRSVRIVDVACGAGDLLLRAVRHARALGFVAIEALGIDRDPQRIARARAAARAGADPAIGLVFAVGDPRHALEGECEIPADLVLYEDGDLVSLAETAGITAIRSRVSPRAERRIA